MPRSFALGGHFDSFIDAQVLGGRYNNASEVIRDALRLLEDREQARERERLELGHLAGAGRAGGFSDAAGAALLERLERKYRGMVAEGG